MGSEQPNDIGNAGGFKHRNLPTIMYIEATVTMTATDAHIVKEKTVCMTRLRRRRTIVQPEVGIRGSRIQGREFTLYDRRLCSRPLDPTHPVQPANLLRGLKIAREFTLHQSPSSRTGSRRPNRPYLGRNPKTGCFRHHRFEPAHYAVPMRDRARGRNHHHRRHPCCLPRRAR